METWTIVGLVLFGVLVGVEMLDHLVVGASRYYSFAEECEHAIPVD